VSESFLDVKDISKRFGGLQALSMVSLQAARNSVHGIIGPNGAGKTTLFNIITGITGPDSGEISLEGSLLPRRKPHLLVPLGVARTFQNIRLFKSMSVLDNVLIGQHIHTPTAVFSILVSAKSARRWEEVAHEEAMKALEAVGLSAKADEMVTNLPYGQQRLVEFARALATKPKLILLDEPAAGMNLTEKRHLVDIVADLKLRGYSIVLIDHDMKLVMNICDMITVLDHGKIIAEGQAQAIRSNPDVIRAYLGKNTQYA
jgi:branched-chain amino acid transport system ATP-binding protein